jgi:hypothetical protein
MKRLTLIGTTALGFVLGAVIVNAGPSSAQEAVIDIKAIEQDIGIYNTLQTIGNTMTAIQNAMNDVNKALGTGQFGDVQTLLQQGFTQNANYSKAQIGAQQQLAVHWAMVVGTHPFFFDVAAHVGQLTKLHGQVNRSQLKRRMAETWGERSTVERAILRVVQSMEQWGVVRPGEDKGSVIGSSRRITVTGELGHLLVHAVLLCSGRGLPFSKLVEHPAVFPFSVHLTARELIASPVFRVQRQGDQQDLVELA